MWNHKLFTHKYENIKAILEEKLKTSNHASYAISVTDDAVVMVVGAKRGWKRSCHRHPADFHMVVLEGKMQFKTHESVKPMVLRRGDDAFIPKYQPHKEHVFGRKTLYTLLTISPNVNPRNLTEFIHADECDSRKSPPLFTPDIVRDEQGPVDNVLPDAWSATILMHPFSE